MGTRWRTDPRYGDHLLNDLELAQLTKAYKKTDPPPEKVKPIPLPIVRQACRNQPNTRQGRARANAITNGFFYLLRPGEYVHSSKYDHPIRLQDTTFHHKSGFYNGATAPITKIKTSKDVVLNFPDQKNGDKNQPINHGDTRDAKMSPVKSVRDQVLHLRANNAPPTTPLYTYYVNGQPNRVTARELTNALRTACKQIGNQYGISPKDISARALRNGGCVALIRAGVDPLIAQLMGRWRSWAMIEYLQTRSLDTKGLAQRMVDSGSYVIPHHQFLPQDVYDLARPYILD